MQGPAPLPRISKILWTDYPAFLFTAFAVVVWVVYLSWVPGWRKDGPVINPELAPFVLIIALALTLWCVGVVIYRIIFIRRIFRDGRQVRGKITDFYLRRDRGKVTYTFFFDNNEYTAGAPVHRNKQTIAIKKGERVILVVDPVYPQRALIRDLYLEPHR